MIKQVVHSVIPLPYRYCDSIFKNCWTNWFITVKTLSSVMLSHLCHDNFKAQIFRVSFVNMSSVMLSHLCHDNFEAQLFRVSFVNTVEATLRWLYYHAKNISSDCSYIWKAWNIMEVIHHQKWKGTGIYIQYNKIKICLKCSLLNKHSCFHFSRI
jgi:hypothetical protein